jgi:DNA-binding NarL/FixJ family response regulator
MARPLGLGVAERVAIVDQYRQGHSTWCIARQAGLSQPTICYHLRAASVQMRAKRRGRFAPPCCPPAAREVTQ